MFGIVRIMLRSLKFSFADQRLSLRASRKRGRVIKLMLSSQQSHDINTENGPIVISTPKIRNSLVIEQGEFEAEAHYYPRVLNATIHPLVGSFFSLGNERILARYSHLNPQCDINYLKSMLEYNPTFFKWAGSDLFNVTTSSGQRQMIIVETNSCPSGNF